MLSRVGVVIQVWCGQYVEKELMKMLEERKPVIVTDSGEELNCIFEKPCQYEILDIGITCADLKDFGEGGKYGMAAVGEKLGVNIGCKKSTWKSEEYGVHSIRYGDWDKPKRLGIHKKTYCALDSALMIGCVPHICLIRSHVMQTPLGVTRVTPIEMVKDLARRDEGLRKMNYEMCQAVGKSPRLVNMRKKKTPRMTELEMEE